MKYYIIAGEASGDLHGSNLVKELKRINPSVILRGWGGDLMQKQGVEIVKHYRELAFMGFIEVLANLKTILRNIKFCKEDIQQWKPDALILIDYPGFNLRIAEFAHQQGIKVFYYISPQVWAWKESRVHKIKQCVDRMLVILPFEKEFYKKFGYEVDFVGHPLLDAIGEKRDHIDEWRSKNKLDERPVIALLPGSRRQEIATMLPLMISIRDQFKNYQFVIGAAPSVPPEFYHDLIKNQDIKIVFNESYNLLSNAYAALVTSGTATLETALFEVPEVVCYKGNSFSYQIAKRLIKVKYISLVNLVMDREIVKELIQYDLTPENLERELSQILEGTKRNEMIGCYQELKKKLGGKGASGKAADLILKRSGG